MTNEDRIAVLETQNASLGLANTQLHNQITNLGDAVFKLEERIATMEATFQRAASSSDALTRLRGELLHNL